MPTPWFYQTDLSEHKGSNGVATGGDKDSQGYCRKARTPAEHTVSRECFGGSLEKGYFYSHTVKSMNIHPQN